jgi:hypothetical protein
MPEVAGTRRVVCGDMSSVEIVPFEPEHAAGIARLCTTVQWPSLTDPDVVLRICTAPGSSAYTARLLTVATFQATATKRMDLITDDAEGFYESFEHKAMAGFRIYPGA